MADIATNHATVVRGLRDGLAVLAYRSVGTDLEAGYRERVAALDALVAERKRGKRGGSQ